MTITKKMYYLLCFYDLGISDVAHRELLTIYEGLLSSKQSSLSNVEFQLDILKRMITSFFYHDDTIETWKKKISVFSKNEFQRVAKTFHRDGDTIESLKERFCRYLKDKK